MGMKRLAPYLGVIVAIVFTVSAVAVANSVTIRLTPVPNTPVASSTLSVRPNLDAPPIPLPSSELAANTESASPAQATSTAKKVSPAPVSAVAPTPAPIPTQPQPSAGNAAALDATALALREALVNIICYAPAGGVLRSLSGSGVIIDPKGIILTNAHIAQNFLLADRGVSCSIRAGSPAVKRYEAALIFISSAWLNANASVLTQSAPSGTGEYDFALLAITKSATVTPLPAQFPFLPLAETPSPPGTPVVIGSYGAQFLESSQIQSSLFPTVVFGSVKNVFTFGKNTIDVLALGGSAAAQQGSSGGGIADARGMLVGTITTSTIEGATDTRSLDAITASYIRAQYANETGSALDALLAKPTAAATADFAPQMPTLESVITAHLP